MQEVDVVIVGGGLAGSTAAAMLGRAGIDAVLIDPHPVYPPDFRAEKLDASQVELLRKTGLAGVALNATTPIDEISVARGGRLVDTRPNDQYGFAYDAFVNAMRARVSPDDFIVGKVSAITTSNERQTVTLADGQTISARLVVLANGLNLALRAGLGIENELVSVGHSVSVGFDLAPVGRPSFGFQALTYWPEDARERIAYLTLFPIGGTMRANLFVYREPRDPWLAALRASPRTTMIEAMPGLARLLGDFEVIGDVKARPVDLSIAHGYRRAGVVLIGDAFATSCPAAGTGCNKVFTDVERLCNLFIPFWLVTPEMGADKITQFYDDPEKRACDEHSFVKAFALRNASIDTSLTARIRRTGKFVGHLGVGMLRRLTEPSAVMPLPSQPGAAASGQARS